MIQIKSYFNLNKTLINETTKMMCICMNKRFLLSSIYRT